MGLAGRKQKQRIPADPRNLSWADDASRFGLSYLSKFGWDASQGLGSSGDGIKTHVKVQQKLDMMGIGLQHQRDPNGIAWKQNKEFETLLKRLNQSAERGEDDVDVGVCATGIEETFVRAREEKVVERLINEPARKTNKREHEDGLDASEDTKKRRKKEKKEMRERRQESRPSSADLVDDPTSEPSSALSSSKPQPRPMAHRARIRAAKRIAGKSASAIAEILGIAPSSSVSSSTSTPAPTPPSLSTPAPRPSLSLDNLTTSTKSVADYFKEKLVARSFPSSSPASSSAPSGSATPGLGATRLGPFSPPEDVEELPRTGIGIQPATVPLPLRVPEPGSTSIESDSNVDDGSAKRRWKAERKAERRKRMGGDNFANREDTSIAVVEQAQEDGAEKVEERKQKKRRKRKEQALADQTSDNDGGTTEKRHDHDTPSGPLPEPRKKSKKECKKKRSFS